MKAKIINGILEYYQQPAWLLGDATSHAISEGYKELINREGPGGIFEEGDFIVSEYPPADNWLHPDRSLRISVPIVQLFSSPNWIGLWNYTQAMEIPSYKEGNNRIFYLEDILPDHVLFLQSQGITIENKPQ